MATQYTDILKLALPTTGELSGTWGDTVNDNITSMVEEAIAGLASISSWSGNAHTLSTANGTTAESRAAMLVLSDDGAGNPSAAAEVICPAKSKLYVVKNDCGQTATIKTSAGTGIAVPDGETAWVYCDGTNVVEAVTNIVNFTSNNVDIGGGEIDGTPIGANSASTGDFTTLTASTSLDINSSTVVDGILDEDNMASDSATKLATQQSIKAYVDAQVGVNNELSEVLANGNTSGGTNLVMSVGDTLTTDTIAETTAGAGVTIDSVLLKDDTVNASDVETTYLSANDGTQAAVLESGTGKITLASSVLTTTDINGGTIDGVTIGGSSAGAITGTTITGTSFVTSGDMTFGDNDKAIFGAGSDLQIYHDGTRNYIDSGTTELRLQTSDLRMVNSNNTEIGIRAVEDGAVTLYYDEIAKLATTSTGIDVTGTVTADGASLDGAVVINESGADVDFRVESDSGTHSLFVDGQYSTVSINTNNSLQSYDAAVAGLYILPTPSSSNSSGVIIQSQGYNTSTPTASLHFRHWDHGGIGYGGKIVSQRRGNYNETAGSKDNALDFYTTTGGVEYNRLRIDYNGDISFYEDTGTTAKFFWDASAETLSLGSTTGGGTAGSITLENANRNQVITFTDGTLSFYLAQQTASNSYVADGEAGAPVLWSDGKKIVFGTNSSAGQQAALVINTDNSCVFNGNITFRADEDTFISRAAANTLAFTTGGSERMRITSSGEVLIGTSSVLPGSIEGLHINTSQDTGISFGYGGASKGWLYYSITGVGMQLQTNAGTTIRMVSNSAGVSLSNGATSWSSLSDERRKDIIEPIENAAEKISTLRAVIGKFKEDEEGTRRAFLIAQDVQKVLPEAVTEEKNGDLLLQYTETIPLLVAAIKEQQALIQALETRIAALESN